MKARAHQPGPMWVSLCLALVCVLSGWAQGAAAQTADQSTSRPTLTVGSKRFTESYILGELIASVAAQAQEARVILRPGLGNTGILIAALKNGEIDLYPEYTGTIVREILHSQVALSTEQMNQQLAPLGLAASVALGFNNTYALAMREELAEQLNIESISDLKKHPELRLGLTQEFIGRQDGWPGLRLAYDLPQQTPRGIDHGLIYGAIAARQVDVMDAYTTDAMLLHQPIRILRDDLGYFPSYDAVLLYRADLPDRLPRSWAALVTLTQTISARAMITMNSQAEQDKTPVEQVAQGFFERAGALSTQQPLYPSSTASLVPAPSTRSFFDVLFGGDFWRLTREHLVLVLVSLGISIVLGIPLGVLAARFSGMRHPVLGLISAIHTIPSLALFALFIPLLGMIGAVPAICALVLYGLLPIVRNTYSGLSDLPAELNESAAVLGLGQTYRLFHIELPLAARSILSGIKTAAIITVGTATIAAFIGAGGYGERIAQGLALNDHAMLLAGALPAAGLALLVHALFEFLERWLVPAGLKAEPVTHATAGKV